MIAGVLHTGFSVSDINRSVQWYTDVLELELVHRQRGDNPYTRTLIGVHNAVIEVAQFRMPSVGTSPSTHVLELIQYVEGAAPEANVLSVNAVGTGHLAFVVTDIHERYERMSRAGARFVNPPVAITEGANAGGYACYLRDPDGITLELLQFSPERMDRLGLGTSTPTPEVVVLHSILHDGHVDGYREAHMKVPDGLLHSFKREGIHDWQIWRSGQHLFHYVTVDDFDAAMAGLSDDPVNVEWQAHIGFHTARFEGPDGKTGLEASEHIWGMVEQLADHSADD